MIRFHMRRKDKEITDPEVTRRILRLTQYVTLAMSLNDEPYLVSLSHGYDEESNCVYFHCAKEGKKLEYLKSNNKVWGQAILDHGYSQGKCTHLYASVQFSGRVTLLRSEEEKRQALQCMMKQLDSNPEAMAAMLSHEGLGGTTVGRIDIEHMSGKKSVEVTI